MEFEATQEQNNLRVDVVLANQFDGKSRSYYTKACSEGYVFINSKPVQAKHKVKTGDTITVKIPESNPKPIDIPVIYQDENVIVINKPAGVLSHSKGAYNPEYTVADFFQSLVTDDTSDRPGIVHRLDRGTSGVMIGSLNLETKRHLQKQFSERNVKKSYLAVVEGTLKDDEARIDIPIERNPKHPSTFRAGMNGKDAQTEFTVLQRSTGRSLVEVRPYTGRTHQIRVHLAHLGHPVVGDVTYGAKESTRTLLHANKLEITLPGGKRRVFEAQMPEEFVL